jgi:micrococcal nuclease
MTFSISALAEPDLFKVQRIVDGDTVVLDKIGKVRLIGVDTPETKDPRRPVQFFGKEATEFLERTLSGKKVRVEYDQTRKDRYNRTLAYIFLEDGTFVNSHIIEKGYGFAYTKFPFKYLDKFRTIERKAREQKVGLWADSPKVAASVPAGSQNSQFSCAKKNCSQIKTCEEAYYLLNQCGLGKLDGDKDGIPCETLCGNGK